MHTCDIVLNLAHAARAEGVMGEQLSAAQYSFDEALRHLEETRLAFDAAAKHTASCIYAVGDVLPCNADEITPIPGSMPVGQSIN